jgi:predicted porin
MKKLLVIAVATALIAPAAAMADTTLYGKLHVSGGQVKTTTGGVTTKNNVVESNVSRFGVKGSSALDNGLSATYGLEYGIDLDGDQSRTLSARNTFVGVKGGFGEVRVGRHDTPAKLATAGLDEFADTYADMSNIIATDAHRVDNAVAYIGKVGPVGVAVAHSTALGVLPAEAVGLTGASIDAGTNDATGKKNDANTMMVNYGNGPYYAGLGYTAIQNTAKFTNLGLGWKAEAGHNVGLVVERQDNANTTSDNTNVYLAGGYKLGNTTLKAGYGESKTKNAGKEKQSTLGVDYSLGKKTSVYGLLNEDKNTAHVLNGKDKTSAAVVGLVTEF